ncbi:MAG: hypothetical protein ACTHXI_05775, partial [Halomonadaceae bacterium]
MCPSDSSPPSDQSLPSAVSDETWSLGRSLREALEEANYRYYVLDEPTLTDADYDRKLRRLQEL